MIKETRNEAGELHSFNGEPAVEHSNGYKKWYQDGELHRVNGLAVVHADGYKAWYQYGVPHRLDGPAIECADGYKAWFQNGELHRLDGPAVEHADGIKVYYIEGKQLSQKEFLARTAKENVKKETRNEAGELHSFNDEPALINDIGYNFWYQNGQIHRLDGPAVVHADGYKAWYQNGKRHRVDGPAVVWASGHKEWLQNGKLHRDNGPAVEFTDGTKKYYIEGKQLSEKEFLARTAKPSKLKLFKEIYTAYDAGEKWLSQIPNEINEAFFDNPFVEAQIKISELLMKHIFTEDEQVAVEWFLHDWYHNRDLSLRLNGEEFEFLCLDDYLSYLQTHEGWE